MPRHLPAAPRERVAATESLILVALRQAIETNPALQATTRAAALAKPDRYKADVG